MAARSDVGSTEFSDSLQSLRSALDARPDATLEFAWRVHHADQLNTAGSHGAAEQDLTELLDSTPFRNDEHFFVAQRILAEAILLQGRPLDAIKLLSEPLAARETPEALTEPRLKALLTVANARLEMGDYSGVLARLLELAPLPPLPGDPLAPARLEYVLGKTYERMGNLAAARASYARALAAAKALRPRASAQGLATFELRLGSTELALGDHSQAATRFGEVYEFAREHGLGPEASYAQFKMGTAALAGGDVSAARRYADAAYSELSDSGSKFILPRVAELQGRAALAGDRVSAALRHFEEAADLYQQRNNQVALADTLAWLANAQLAAGQATAAAETLTRAFAITKQAHEARQAGQTSRLLALFEAENARVRSRLLEGENRLEELEIERRTAWTYLQTMISVTLLAMLAMASLLIWRQRRYQSRLEKLASTDSLTGLLNYRSIHKAGERLTARSWHEAQPLSVVVADIDEFKQVNDSHGHDAGDRVIQRVAAALSAGLREGDRAGRLGGEEFLLVLPGSRADGAALVAERIRASIAAGDGSEVGDAVSVTVSFGVAELAEAHGNFVKLVKLADERLYEAKEAGRNRVIGGPGPYLSSVE